MPINSFLTQFIGRQFLHLAVCDSTNAVVMQKLAADELQNGAIVLADFQTAGRGQRDARWDAAAGLNLTFTIALFPKLKVQQQFYLNIITTLALSDCLRTQLGEPFKIKWPNDLYYNNHKLSGILIQNNLKVNMIHSCAIGIGINVNQMHFEKLQATSLKAITKSTWDKQALLKDIAIKFEERYYQLQAGELLTLKEEYLSQLYWLDEWHSFEDGRGVFRGKIYGLSDEGELLVKRERELKKYYFKEISYLQ
ncbi:biotin--[acetyl-CoA-carboxylase] ligase [Porifericola rhodea]|uniref:biotin--[acetyl-CoA-carboxylase] ligase n=1 Tax=Porifericola rhodea TaxID=930972 RepID=UPI002665F4AB|nr:biotin--[acetyl-CoA-carboxylase] ligase [Porifericola rhodea]WKN32045.1 biotin--[acetyl-CoA-carboxylase] ligase [Porifericola rhodea]